MELLILLIKEKYKKALIMRSRNPNEEYYVLVSAEFPLIYYLGKFNTDLRLPTKTGASRK